MRRALSLAASTIAVLALTAGSAQALAPSLGTTAATNIQGVSALLVGTVDPEGLASTYRYQYGTSPSLTSAAQTQSESAGEGTEAVPARAAIAGLTPDTTYYFRLVASNSSGTTTGATESFTTTHGFGFLPGTEGFAAAVWADGGAAASKIGSHPYQLDFELGLNPGGAFEGQPGASFPDGDLRDLEIEMPAGLLLNPSVLATCSRNRLRTPRSSPFDEGTRSGEDCPRKSQVGTVELQGAREGGLARRFGLFNLDPAPGVAAQLGAAPYGAPVVFDVDLRPGADGSYAFSLRIRGVPQALDFHAVEISLWGTPWANSHDGERGDCLNESEPAFPWAKCAVGDPLADIPHAFLTLPSQCSSSLAFTATASSWQQPGEVGAVAVNRDSEGKQIDLSDCQALPFSPRPIAQLTNTRASSPSGFAFDLENDHEALLDPEARSPSQAREAVVSLPSGVNVNPSVGAGLGACTPAQYAAETAFSASGAGCPNASKIGNFELFTPLFSGHLVGAVYLAEPHANPFGSLVAIYLVARLSERGIVVKIPGELALDSVTGDLRVIFSSLPQLPYTDLTMSFRAGQRSLLVTPTSCGTATTRSELRPWAGTSSVVTLSHSPISSGIGGGACPPPGAPPFDPSVVAGGVNSNVNSYTPYFIHIARQDTEQEITSYSLVLPEGVTAKLAGIPYCPEAAIEAARHRSGVAEEVAPSCPAASQVGRVLTGYGVGSSLTYTEGRIYLAGPTGGRPLSVVAIIPATVGPFDVGTVVLRSAFSIDERTAQLRLDHSASDRIPHILQGIPLRLRDIRIYLDRPQFTHNPSSCAPANLISNLTGAGVDFSSEADDSTSTSARHFQLLNCLILGFRPRLGIRLRGPTRRGAYPQLRATFVARGPGDTNLKQLEINMPRQLFIAQNHIRKVCTRVQFAAERCPPGSVYGRAVAYTPLLDEPLRGKVYLRSSSHKLPDLVASLRSGALRIVLEGKIGSTKQGGIRALFRDLPDQPVDRFVMILRGGRRGLLQNSANICKVPPEATVQALGQTNLGRRFTTVLRGQCKKKKKKAKRRARVSLQSARRSGR